MAGDIVEEGLRELHEAADAKAEIAGKSSLTDGVRIVFALEALRLEVRACAAEIKAELMDIGDVVRQAFRE